MASVAAAAAAAAFVVVAVADSTLAAPISPLAQPNALPHPLYHVQPVCALDLVVALLQSHLSSSIVIGACEMDACIILLFVFFFRFNSTDSSVSILCRT